VRVRVIGSRDGLSDDLLTVINRVETVTQNNSEFFLNIAFNYGGRDEIIRAMKRAAANGHALDDMDETILSQHLDTTGLPEPELIIRTSGERRVSNFLMWQTAYSEFVFTDVLWPDFARKDLEKAIFEFQTRERRFGSLKTDEVA